MWKRVEHIQYKISLLFFWDRGKRYYNFSSTGSVPTEAARGERGKTDSHARGKTGRPINYVTMMGQNCNISVDIFLEVYVLSPHQ